jgi:hypothetical protein
LKRNLGLICFAFFIFLSIISYYIFRKINKNVINKHLKKVQDNDCQPFNEELIGKEKYFFRKYFVRNPRETTIAVFNHAIAKPKKLLNKLQDNYTEEGKYFTIYFL